jgi:hypothetical protein
VCSCCIPQGEKFPDKISIGIEIREKVASYVDQRIKALRAENKDQFQVPCFVVARVSVKLNRSRSRGCSLRRTLKSSTEGRWPRWLLPAQAEHRRGAHKCNEVHTELLPQSVAVEALLLFC